MVKNQRNKIFIIGVLLILAFSVFKAFFWLGYKDEPFYFTSSLQMIKGDTLFTEIWGILGFQGWLLYPLIKGFVWITGGTTNIILCFRMIYIAIHFFVGIIAYKRLEKYTKSAYAIVWLFLLFNPMNHQLLSYNSIPFLFGFLGVILLATVKRKADYYICGILYACSVLLQPILGVEFFAISIILLIAKRKTLKKIIKEYCLFVAGCLTLAIPVLIYIVFYTKIDGFFNYLKYSLELYKDGLHPHGGIIGYFKYYFWSVFPDQKIVGSFGTGIISVLILTFILVLFVIQLLKNIKKIQDDNLIIRLMMLGCVLYSIVCAIATLQLPTTVNMIPWFLLGIVSYPKCKNAFIKKYYRISIMWTIIYGIALLSSDTGMKTLSIAIFSSVLASVAVIYDVYDNGLRNHRKELRVALAISLLCMIIIGAAYPLKTINGSALAKVGPAKNIRDSKMTVNRYNEIMADMKIVNKSNKKSLILSSFVHAYMAYEGENVQYNAFFNHFGEAPMNRLKKYYELYPSKRPQALYITYDDLKKNSLDTICNTLGFDINNKRSLEAGYFIIER